MLARGSLTKEQSWIFIKNFGISYGLQSQDGLRSLNLYTKHMIRIKIYQMFLKHVVDRHHMGSGLTRVLISSMGVLSLGFNCSGRRACPNKPEEHRRGRGTCPWDACWCSLVRGNSDLKAMSKAGARGFSVTAAAEEEPRSRYWWRAAIAFGRPLTPHTPYKFCDWLLSTNTMSSVPFMQPKAKVSTSLQHPAPLPISLVRALLTRCWCHRAEDHSTTE